MYAALQGNVATSAGDAGWQLAAPAATSIAGATLVRKLVVSGHPLHLHRARPQRPPRANTQNFESCSTRPAARTRSHEASLTWTSPRAEVNRLEVYVSCAPTADVACQKVAGGRGRGRTHLPRRHHAERHHRPDHLLSTVQPDVRHR